MGGYVHGYSEREAQRLADQANTLCELLHHDTVFPAGCRVLEAGCGIGAQTAALARSGPGAEITCIDISQASIDHAKRAAEAAGLSNVCFRRCDLHDLPFENNSFDYIFLCHVLEHLENPITALHALAAKLRPGGTVIGIEGDHGSCYWHPETAASREVWQCLVDVQAALGGDSLIGRRLYPLFCGAGFCEVRVSARQVYCDEARPDFKDGFVAKTIIPMVEGVRDEALARQLIDTKRWDEGIRDLYRVAEQPDGTFCYTFFKVTAVKAEK